MFQSIKKVTKNIIPFMVLATALHVEAKDMSQIDIATNYYDSLYKGDYSTVRQLASSDLIFKDPTAPEGYGVPNQIDSLNNFVEFFEANSQGPMQVSYAEKFASNDQVVLQVQLKGVVPANMVGMGEGSVEYISNGFTVIHMSNGKVMSHTDYIDYSGTKLTKLDD
ncbi:ester cyclase [Vibrio sp. JC009]|uniref:nuclear transport factor 2 family protein n=1 Tax=Vibrio sp. JC009 TaxID=2912314 RepID=UPI0023AEDED9|nr:ester cyclase [Vibrio sp. JC009]WED24737.1 ester cyclase [Vibrio sp. JC009]